MRNVPHAALASACVAVLSLAGGCKSPAENQSRVAMNASYERLEHGRYLVVLADCVGCHTVPGSDKTFAGGRPIETPFGTLVSPNITPDRETGIGAWSDAEFDAALRQGRAHGSRLYPAMPFTYYAKLSHQDAMDIRSYLNSVAPVDNRVQVNQLPFPFNIRALMAVWDAMYFKSGEFTPDAHQSSEWNRGAFLVEGPGHCGACHTTKSFLGGDISSKYLRGATIQGWFAPDITNATPQGLGRWQPEDIVAYLKSGHTQVTAASGLMAEEIGYSSSKFSDSDLHAIATYLKSLGGENDEHPAIASTDPRMQAGAAIYVDRCSACHAMDGKGVANLFPSLADSSAVRAADPTTLVRIVLRGGRSVATDPEPTGPAMPSFDWQLTDTQVADVLTYIRNQWGAAAKPIDASDVRDARAQVATRAD